MFDSNGPTITDLIQGNVKYALAQDSALIAKMKSGAPIKIVYPASGVTTLSSNIAIDSKAPHAEVAKEFVNFALSQEGQKILAAGSDGDNNYESIVKGAPGKAGIRPSGIKWNELDASYSAKHENEIKQWFTENIVQK
ncbi:extracellular solute-binding protein [Aneurinibacillus sp. Ricciae_BoGa-3]|nr:extracellular solute-binding protein [Aneurinibacillus sp. Ricciae_BoGa-3]WCK54584.1 extracellular solute-binding protein [Aneurinibacillus sp. Ricciae_BoGa-3]